jgi:hypothetical protein
MAFPFEVGPTIIAIGALGTAAFALVDATKIGRNGGISNSGFAFIQDAVREFFPGGKRRIKSSSGETLTDVEKLLNILHSQWISGVALSDQKAIAKSLIKLRLTHQTADAYAAATLVDRSVLRTVATKITQGAELTQQEMNALGRFDLALTAILDEGYQRADQRYRNSTKVLASVVAVVLAMLGGFTMVDVPAREYFMGSDIWTFALAGIFATPLAPIAKDVASALQAGVKVAQAVRGRA